MEALGGGFGKTAKAVGVAWCAANTLLKQGVNEMRAGILNSPWLGRLAVLCSLWV